MKISKFNIIGHELVGLRAKVVMSSDPTLRGVEGLIADETKRALRLASNGRLKTIPKSIGTLELTLPDGSKAIFDGALILGRPEERIARLG